MFDFWDTMDCSTPGIPVHHHLPELAQTHAHWVGDPIQLSHPLLSPYPPALNLSQHQGLFQWVRWPKFWSVSFSISPSDEYLGLISFRMDWLDLLKSKGLSRVFSNTTIQKHQFSALSFLYSSTLTSIHDYWKTIALTRWTFVGKVMSLLFNMLSRLVIAFLPRNSRLLISWLP